MFNVLNSVNALMSENQRNAKRMIIQFSRLLRHTLVASSKQTAPLGDEMEAVEHYLAIEKLRFEERIEVSVEAQRETLNLNVPVFLVQPLVENAIKYGMQTNQGTLKLVIQCSLQDRYTPSTSGEHHLPKQAPLEEVLLDQSPFKQTLPEPITTERVLCVRVQNSGEWLGETLPSLIHNNQHSVLHGDGTPPTKHKRRSTGIGLDNLRKRLQQLYPHSHTMSIEAVDGSVIVEICIAVKELVAEAV
jgi:LytS/YehU family sensor histidine kinase